MGMSPGMPFAPPQPEMQQAQQGLGPVANRNMPPPNAHGVLLASADAIRSVLEKMSGEEPGFAPFARQALSAIASGVSAVMSAPASELPQEMPQSPPPGGPGVPLG